MGLIGALYACTGGNAQNRIPSAEHFNNEWAKESTWDQGKAEVAKYQATRTIYGKPRNFEYVFILVKETFNEKYNVKTDSYDRNDLFDVMKVNKFARIPTDNYPYHYMTSIFYKRDQPSMVHKLTNSSQEWCGTTAKHFTADGKQYKFGYISYWDGQGVGETKISGGFMFEDQLSHSLRALKFSDGLSFQQAVAESQVSSKAKEPTVYNATFRVEAANDLQLSTDYDMSQVNDVWKVTVQLDNTKTNEYWFSSNYPNIMLKQHTWDGRNYELKESYMDDYWVIEGNSWGYDFSSWYNHLVFIARIRINTYMKRNYELTAIIERESDGYVSLCPELDIARRWNDWKARDNLIEALELFFETASQHEISGRLHNEVLVTRVSVSV